MAFKGSTFVIDEEPKTSVTTSQFQGKTFSIDEKPKAYLPYTGGLMKEIKGFQQQAEESKKTQKNIFLRAGEFIQKKLFPGIETPKEEEPIGSDLIPSIQHKTIRYELPEKPEMTKVSLSNNLQELKIIDTDTLIPQQDFTPEMKTVFDELTKHREKTYGVLETAPPKKEKKDTIFTDIARFLLPRKLEVSLGISKPNVVEKIKIAEKDREDYYGYGEDFVGGIKTFGEGLIKLPQQFAVAVLKATQGSEGASVVDKDWADRFIQDANKDMETFIAETQGKYKNKVFLSGIPIKITDFAELPQNLSYSLTSMGAGLGVGLPTAAIPLPGARVAAWIAGTAASGKVAYEMTTYEIMQQYLEIKNDESIKTVGKGITAEEEKKLKEEFNDLANQYGLWEAVPEALSNLAFVGLLTAPLTKMVGKSVAGKITSKLVGIYGEELLTETVTQMGQMGVLGKAGMPGGREINWLSPTDWIQSFKEVAPQTFLLTTIMSGAGTVTVSANKIYKSLENEIGKKHPLYGQLSKKIEENIAAGVREISLEKKVEEKEVKPEVKGKESITKIPGFGEIDFEKATFKPEEIKKGEVIQIKNIETGKTESVGFVSQKENGIIAKREGVGIPMLFKDTKWEIVKEKAPEIKPIPKELEPLTKEAMKYDSAEEFVKNYDGGLILDRAKVNNWIAGGPNNIAPVSELLGVEGKKFMQEMELPDLPVRVQEASEETIGHYAQIEWRGGNRLKDAQINIEISSAEEFGVENLADKEESLLHELAHAKQIVLNRLGGKKIQSEISEISADKHANYIFNRAKSQLTSIYNQAKGVGEVKPALEIAPSVKKEAPEAVSEKERVKPQVLAKKPITIEVKPMGKVTSVAKSIEAKAIEQGLTTKGFNKLAEYSPIVIREQSKMMSDIMGKDMERAKRIATGKESLPKGLKGATALSAMEDYAMETKDGQLALDLANSPIATEISIAGQTLRLAEERTPDSATARIREIAKEREKAVEKRLKGKTISKAKSEIKDSLEKKIKEAKISKYNWGSFIDSITC